MSDTTNEPLSPGMQAYVEESRIQSIREMDRRDDLREAFRLIRYQLDKLTPDERAMMLRAINDPQGGDARALASS